MAVAACLGEGEGMYVDRTLPHGTIGMVGRGLVVAGEIAHKCTSAIGHGRVRIERDRTIEPRKRRCHIAIEVPDGKGSFREYNGVGRLELDRKVREANTFSFLTRLVLHPAGDVSKLEPACDPGISLGVARIELDGSTPEHDRAV